jgi:heptaprenyl diphosphate synthase
MVILALLSYLPGRGCGPLGYSVASAISHMTAQFWTAYWLFIHHDGLFHLLPLLMTAALVFGVLSGIITLAMLKELLSDGNKEHYLTN